MEKLLASMGLRYLATKLNGKKTYFGGVALMLLGLIKFLAAGSQLVYLMWPDLSPPEITGPLDMDTVLQLFQEGGGLFSLGLATFGIGHKIEKSNEK